MPMNAAARRDPSARGWVGLSVLIAALLLVAGMVLTGSGLAGTAEGQAEAGAIPSLTLDSNEPGQLVITWATPDPVPTDYRIRWANASMGFPSYNAPNEPERGNSHPAGDANTLTLDNLTPGENYKVQIPPATTTRIARFTSGAARGRPPPRSGSRLTHRRRPPGSPRPRSRTTV